MRRKRPVHAKFDEADEALKEKVPEPLAKEPYKVIYEHAENKMKFAGGKVYKYGALQILSPYAPKLEYAGSEKRISINIMLIGNSGSGKTELMKIGDDFSPFDKKEWVQKMTEKALKSLVNSNDEGVQMYVNDLKTVMGDSNLLKAMESVIADGIIKYETSNDKMDNEDARAAMMSGAVPSDIKNQIYGGLIFRIVPIELQYTDEQQKAIGDHITKNVDSDDTLATTEEISDFYDIIYALMMGRFEDYPRIVGYEFNEEHREEINRGWKVAIDELSELGQNINLFRQLWDGFRLAALHALLNVHNREVEKFEDEDGQEVGKVVLTDKDAKVGNMLMQRELDILNGFIAEGDVQKEMAQQEGLKASGKFGIDGL